jgi:hypothetical protein
VRKSEPCQPSFPPIDSLTGVSTVSASKCKFADNRNLATGRHTRASWNAISTIASSVAKGHTLPSTQSGSQARIQLRWGAMLTSNAARHTATGRPFFTCPNCNALYHIIKVEAGPESADREITCRACGGHFLAAKENSS